MGHLECHGALVDELFFADLEAVAVATPHRSAFSAVAVAVAIYWHVAPAGEKSKTPAALSAGRPATPLCCRSRRSAEGHN
jgi:hypothetical protein